MSVRTELLLRLRQEVLGPRHSCYETLPESEDPRSEFITGILIPKSANDSEIKDLESEVDTLGTGAEGAGEDDSEDEDPVGAAPVLDPKSLPRSLGISFIVSAVTGTEPQIDICATWARYRVERDSQTGNQSYVRVPNSFVSPAPIPVSRNRLIDEVDQVQISLRSVPLSGSENSYKVSVYLVNQTDLRGPSRQDEQRVKTSDLIFQPQMRIVTAEGTILKPFDSFKPADVVPKPGSLDEEDESLALIYRDYQAYARGHLCAAVWKEIDPERPCPNGQPNLLEWIDGEVVQSQYGRSRYEQFRLPDCRTEYVPCYPVQSPEIGWRQGLTENEPQLSAARLAETWNPSDMREGLQPLVDGYGLWIQSQESQVAGLEPKYQRAAQRHLANCRRAAERVQEAIALLMRDEQVRLAFCFANQAISLQASWRRSREFKWRPFQLAFVLMNLPAIADPLHSDRQTCDLLAFPTGGVKRKLTWGWLLLRWDCEDCVQKLTVMDIALGMVSA